MDLLIRIIDKQPAASMLSETASQRGDLIAACPDGWAWTAIERDNPDWIIEARIKRVYTLGGAD